MRNHNGIRGYAIQAIQSNPQIRNNPQFSKMIQAIEQDDSALGEQLANRILQNYGVTKEEAIQRAIQTFGLKG